MGLLVMLAGVVVVFFLLKTQIGGIGAAVISGLLFVVWFFINSRAGTKGLVNSNMRAYFVLRSQGTSHKDALNGVIHTRYPVSSEKRENVSRDFHLMVDGRSKDEREDIELLIYTIFINEAGLPPTREFENKMFLMIEDSYDSMNSKFSLSPKNHHHVT